MIDPTNARRAAIAAIHDAVVAYPDIPADTLEPYLAQMSRLPGAAEQRGKAVALHRTVLQRWLTLTFLLNAGSRNPVEKFEPPVQAALLVGAAELLFFDSPAFAVIDETVEACRAMNRLKAVGLVNALLRRIAELKGEPREEDHDAGRAENVVWQPSTDTIPDAAGHALRLTQAVLPDTSNLVRHLSVATSHPRPLVRRWVEEHGEAAAQSMLQSGLRVPSVFAVDEQNASTRWGGSMAELSAWLDADPLRRVQDPASTRAVAATDGFKPGFILDLCAGRGTKTRQLLVTHPDARVVAWDPDHARRADLFTLREALQAKAGRELGVWQPRGDERFDLILLDVPCSNTGVLARRPEARYRWNPDRLGSLVEIQREIIDRALGLIAPGGVLVYSTCSVDAEENGDQAAWAVDLAKRRGLGGVEVVAESQLLPGGTGENAHDGSYHAVVRVGV